MAEGIKTHSGVAEAAGSAAGKRITPDGRVPDPRCSGSEGVQSLSRVEPGIAAVGRRNNPETFGTSTSAKSAGASGMRNKQRIELVIFVFMDGFLFSRWLIVGFTVARDLKESQGSTGSSVLCSMQSGLMTSLEKSGQFVEINL
jgi:hypothetical protein